MFDDLIFDKEKRIKERMKERMKILKEDNDEEDEDCILDQFGYVTDNSNNNTNNKI